MFVRRGSGCIIRWLIDHYWKLVFSVIINFTMVNLILYVAPKISLYAGVISLGFGDSLAAIVGSTWGRFKWPGELVYTCSSCSTGFQSSAHH